MAAKTEESGIPSFYTEEENLQKLCNFLRSNEGPPVRNALLMDKRVLYLKGQLSIRRLEKRQSVMKFSSDFFLQVKNWSTSSLSQRRVPSGPRTFQDSVTEMLPLLCAENSAKFNTYCDAKREGRENSV